MTRVSRGKALRDVGRRGGEAMGAGEDAEAEDVRDTGTMSRRAGIRPPRSRSETDAEVDAAIALWRARLSRPLTACFRDRPPSSMTQPPAGEWNGLAIHRITVYQEIAESAERGRVIESIRSPVDVAFRTSQKGHTAHHLVAVIYGVAGGLTSVERELLERRHADQMKEFESQLQQSHATLCGLTMRGADPMRVLSILIRHCWRRGTELSAIQSVKTSASDFDLTIPRGRKALSPTRLEKFANGVLGNDKRHSDPCRLERTGTPLICVTPTTAAPRTPRDIDQPWHGPVVDAPGQDHAQSAP